MSDDDTALRRNVRGVLATAGVWCGRPDHVRPTDVYVACPHCKGHHEHVTDRLLEVLRPAQGVHVDRAPDPRPQQILDDPAGWFARAREKRAAEVLAEAAGRAKEAGERRLGRPTWAGLFGADPDFTDGKDVGEWLDEGRGQA